MTSPDTRRLMDAEALALLRFGALSRTDHGFGWLADDGSLLEDKGVPLWVTGRMTHCFALGALMGPVRQSGDPDCPALAAHGIRALSSGPLRDEDAGAWRSAVELDGTPRPGDLVAYDHSFVVLAASSAALAGIPGAADLLDQGLECLDRLWWEQGPGMVLDARDATTLQADPYRGANANMHWVEALLAAYAATGDDLHLERASRITTRMAQAFAEHRLRLPEHYSTSWEAILDYNQDVPADPFRPYGSTIGHWLEWARLMVQVRCACDAAGLERCELLGELPAAMYRQALREGWGPDGEPGFVYTVDFQGRAVTHSRMYWVVCEAIGAAETLREVSADTSMDHDVDVFWHWAQRYLIEPPGQWREELDARNQPACRTWTGKPDIYHALQACLVGSLSVTPCFALGLRQAAG